MPPGFSQLACGRGAAESVPPCPSRSTATRSRTGIPWSRRLRAWRRGSLPPRRPRGATP